MNNRVQQRFDRSIRKAVEETQRINESKPRRSVVRPCDETKTNTRRRARTVLLLDPETGGTVLVPWSHPLAIAKRAKATGKGE